MYLNINNENWVPIAGFPGYEISNLGRVKSVGRTIHTPKASYDVAERILKSSGDGKGYLRFSARANGKTYIVYVHQCVLKTFVGPRPPGMLCLHKDGDSTNNRLDNLYYGTYSDNVKDSQKHGTFNSVRPGQKITKEQAEFIKKSTKTAAALAKEFGLRASSVYSIRGGRMWAGITCPKGDTWGNGVKKLAKEQVEEIKNSAGSNKSLARKFGVNPKSISNIRKGKTWKGV